MKAWAQTFRTMSGADKAFFVVAFLMGLVMGAGVVTVAPVMAAIWPFVLGLLIVQLVGFGVVHALVWFVKWPFRRGKPKKVPPAPTPEQNMVGGGLWLGLTVGMAIGIYQHWDHIMRSLF